jgi:hypothetical protein
MGGTRYIALKSISISNENPNVTIIYLISLFFYRSLISAKIGSIQLKKLPFPN